MMENVLLVFVVHLQGDRCDIKPKKPEYKCRTTILKLLKNNLKGLIAKELVSKAGYPKSTVYKNLQKLIKEDKVQKHPLAMALELGMIGKKSYPNIKNKNQMLYHLNWVMYEFGDIDD